MSISDAFAGFVLVLVGIIVFRGVYRADAEKHSKAVNVVSAIVAVFAYVTALQHFTGK